MPIPEYFKGWWVPTTCVFPVKKSWVSRPFKTAVDDMVTEWGNKGLMMSAYKYPEKDISKDSIGWGHLYFDFDGECPKEAKRDAIKLVKYLTETLEISEEHIRSYFSGNKGYHIFVNASVFGITPMVRIHDLYGQIANALKDHLELKTLDTSIYNRQRMIRVTNSIHEKSGKYRVWISLDTLFNVPHFVIINQANKPRPLPLDFTFVTEPETEHVAFLKAAMEAYEKRQAAKSSFVPKDVPEEVLAAVQELPEGVPVCVSDLLDRFMGSGKRFTAQVPIISYFKMIGIDPDTVIELLTDKIVQNYGPKGATGRIEQATSSVHTIYEESYSFTCAGALSVTKYEKTENKVKCAGSNCPLDAYCGQGGQPVNIIL